MEDWAGLLRKARSQGLILGTRLRDLYVDDIIKKKQKHRGHVQPTLNFHRFLLAAL